LGVLAGVDRPSDEYDHADSRLLVRHTDLAQIAASARAILLMPNCSG
jgi:hypothetical protein